MHRHPTLDVGALLAAAITLAGCAQPGPAQPSAATAPALAATAPSAPSCRPAPFGTRDLYARGDFNSWGVDDGARFVYACDHYELFGGFGGTHAFKIADESWSADANFGVAAGQAQPVPGGRPLPLALGGNAIGYNFGPATRLVLAMDDSSKRPTLTINDCPERPSPMLHLSLQGPAATGATPASRAFHWSCDAYYLNVKLEGDQDFRIADAAGTPASTFGAAGGPGVEVLAPGRANAIARGQAGRETGPLRFAFQGEHTLRLAVDGPGGIPTLTIGPKTFADPSAAAITDPVALSVRFDSRDPADKAPFGAVPADTTVSYALDALPGIAKATLVVESRQLEGNQEVLEYHELARVPMTATPAADGRQRWSASHRFAAPGVYGWWFDVEIAGRHYVYANNAQPLYWTREKGTGGLGTVEEMPGSLARIRRFRQTVYARDFTVPDWAQDAVYYYIFPDRFRNGDRRNDPKPGVDKYQDHTVEFHNNWNDKPWRPGSGDGSDAVYNNDFFGGDIAGIIEKLDDIRALGANTLYITPMFAAASNHKYDTADYRRIDPHFGTNDDFVRLCREAAKRGIRVLPDTSLNHVGTDSLYFDRFGNYKAYGNVGAFQDGHIHPESPYAAWFKFDPTQKDPDKQYQGWVGVADLPEIDKNQSSFRDFAIRAPDSITRIWLQRGAAGWRMDVAPWVPDDFWREWRQVVRHEKPDALTVAETWFDASKFFTGDEFDSTMNYIFRSAVIDYAGGGSGAAMVAQLEHLREAYPPQTFHALMNLLSTHDVPRTLHLFGDVDGKSTPEQVALAKQKFRLAVFFQMTYPGSPAIYYGDEVGVTGAEDPMNRGTYPWPDLGGHPDTVLQADVKRLVALRHDHPVLRRGTLLAPLHADAQVVVLARRLGTTWAITATNNDGAPHAVTVTLPAEAPLAGWKDALSGATVPAPNAARQVTLEVPARFGVMWTTP
jgi:glycosidase